MMSARTETSSEKPAKAKTTCHALARGERSGIIAQTIHRTENTAPAKAQKSPRISIADSGFIVCGLSPPVTENWSHVAQQRSPHSGLWTTLPSARPPTGDDLLRALAGVSWTRLQVDPCAPSIAVRRSASDCLQAVESGSLARNVAKARSIALSTTCHSRGERGLREGSASSQDVSKSFIRAFAPARSPLSTNAAVSTTMRRNGERSPSVDAAAAGMKATIQEATRGATMRRLQTMPGVGPITAMAIETFAPPMAVFRRGRDFAAWLGLVPRQHSTGGRPLLGKISKMGQRDIRPRERRRVRRSAVRANDRSDPDQEMQ